MRESHRGSKAKRFVKSSHTPPTRPPPNAAVRAHSLHLSHLTFSLLTGENSSRVSTVHVVHATHAARITHTHTHAPHALHATHTHATIKMRERYYTYMVCLMIRISKRWGRPPPDGRHTKSFTCVVHASAPPIAATAKEANRFSASSSVSDRSFACQLASRNTRRSRLTVHQTVCRPNRRTTARCPVSLSASTNAALAAAAHSPLLWWP